MATRYHLTTTPGLEDIVETELMERFGDRSPRVLSAASDYRRTGYVDVEFEDGGEPDAAVPELRSMRSLYHVVEVRGSYDYADTPELPEIVKLTAAMALPELANHRTFAVRCRRSGRHPFQSVDVEREVGAVLVERYGAPVNLTEPELTVRVLVRDQSVLAGVLHTPEPLDRRYPWVYRPRVTLRTIVAYALLRLARIDPGGEAIVDPFCGSGTIPVETASCFPNIRIFASDIDPVAVATARANIAAAGFEGRVEIRRADAADIAERLSGIPVQAIVTNPPYGVRLGSGLDFGDFYRRFLLAAAAVLPPGGRLVLMSSKRRGRLNRVLSTMPQWSIRHVRVIETGGVYPAIFVLERRS